ncbi:FGGY-family carbohydrate kinase [Aridibaculum aurantiacum]|uniref:FGGY-family carbohydrate kinase n=1 Tax=Aridibaculum aurantiacum TaxID=2810307 RepID=UPI001A95B64A|nr:FGGY family carbohydrate kinase [Aridibaculum aurantiacum]
MLATPVIAVFDVGKTNKKLFLFDKHYKIVYERSARFIETEDENGFPCENLESLKQSVFDALHEIEGKEEFDVKAINFTTYGASFVYIGEDGEPVAPLYNYLKPYSPELLKQFYSTYGGEEKFSEEASSPVLGNLNSGMQLYRMKYEQPEVYAKIKYALHLPQYMSYLITGQVFADITSIGCHTNLWNFTTNDYHEWVYKEGVIEKLPPIVASNFTVPSNFNKEIKVGVGLHDSSAALIPYLSSIHTPFALISTGTWCITLNPFNDTPLTSQDLQMDCLRYMQFKGKPVKASRIFAGNEHEEQVKRIAEHFNQSPLKYRTMPFNAEVMETLQQKVDTPAQTVSDALIKQSAFPSRELGIFDTDEEAYHQLMQDIINQQFASTNLVLRGSEVSRIFVDGGFSKNDIYMNLLAAAFAGKEVFAASVAQATALGTALAMHDSWNNQPIPKDLIELKYFADHEVIS